MSSSARLKIGLLINPIAGMGGRVGLHGTDGDIYKTALQLGAVEESTLRAKSALTSLSDLKDHFTFYAADGKMGGDLLAQLNFSYQPIKYQNLESSLSIKAQGKEVRAIESSAEDTKAISGQFLQSGVDLIVFAGGDGTARDIYSIVQSKVPILGIPAGVKMRSGVFGLHPENVAQIIIQMINPANRRFAPAEILDRAPESEHYSASSFFGVALTAYAPDLIQRSKSTHASTAEVGLAELAQTFAHQMKPDRLYLLGPGSSTNLIAKALGILVEPSGVNAICNQTLIGEDLRESDIFTLLDQRQDVQLVLGVIGGQGYLLGRGNQQLSGAVIEKIGWERIYVIASSQKLLNLAPVQLYIDLPIDSPNDVANGSEAKALTPPPTFIQVHTANARSVVCRIVHNVPSPNNGKARSEGRNYVAS
jgi:predicted polyphosphate/ATP-dependent NAD kinase